MQKVSAVSFGARMAYYSLSVPSTALITLQSRADYADIPHMQMPSFQIATEFDLLTIWRQESGCAKEKKTLVLSILSRLRSHWKLAHVTFTEKNSIAYEHI